MDVLEPWLAAIIEGELGEALKQWDDSTIKHQSIGKSQRLSYDDGSNLRIHSAKKGPIVQINKFLTFEDPIQVTLSDGVIRVNASITNQASHRYAKKNRKKVTDGTVGGLIQLQDFEIVATHLGPRDKRLTLYVKDFKELGSNGSGTFGVTPQAIESREETKKLLSKLAELRRHGLDAHSEQSVAASPIRSQPSTHVSDVENDQDSQIGFATQLPRSMAPIVSKSNPLASITSINLSSTSATESANTSILSTNAKHGNPLASLSTPLQVSAVPQRTSVDDGKTLLHLLKKRKRAPPASERPLKPTLEETSRPVSASSDPAAQERESGSSRPINLAPGDGNASRDPIGVRKRKRQSSEIAPRKKGSNDFGSHLTHKDRENLVVKNVLENAARSGVVVTEASTDTIHSQPTNPSTSRFSKSYPSAPAEPSALSTSRIVSSASDQTTGRDRISSRDVNIPKDQETLLNRADSWLPAEPGQREPSANIPISLLETLNRKADLLAQGTTKAWRRRNDTMIPTPIIDLETTDSESDAPVSSGQWPASPEREKLPPDSSPASAEHSDHSLKRIIDNPPSVSSPRKQSSGSMASHSSPLGRPSPILASHFSGESGPSIRASSGALSPCHQDSTLVLPSHSRSASPTLPGVSTPTSIGSKTWRDRRSGRKVPYSGANEKSNSVEASALMPPIPDGASTTPEDQAIARRRSSANSLLESRIPPDLPHALIQPASNNANQISVDRSPPIPTSPTSESDLEMTIPLALNRKTDPIACKSPAQNFPSTASQPYHPFTQVKRTPYVDSRVQNESHSGPSNFSSPMESSFHPLTNDRIHDNTDFVSASVTSGPGFSNAEITDGNGRSHSIDDQSTGEVAATLAQNNDRQKVIDSNAENRDELIAEVQQGTSERKPPANKGDASSLSIKESQCQSSGLLTVVSEVNTSIPAVPERSVIQEGNHIHHLPQLATSNYAPQMAHEMKRKVADSSFISPSRTKRQKRFKVPLAFTSTERSDAPRDPSLGARQYRQDFLASRRSSESSTPTMSPTMLFAALPGITSEHPRDPSERARQFRQDFLASRRSSETSTPTTSPRPRFAAHTATLQAESRNVEVEKSVDPVALQYSSADNELHRGKTKLEDLSARSQTQGLNLHTAPLLNSTSVVSGDDVTKPGEQDILPSVHEADTLIPGAKNADVRDPDAERRTVIEPSFNASHIGTERAQSVEPEVSVRSPDRQKSANCLMNANSVADQTVDLETDPKGTSHDQVTNMNEDGRPVEPESDEARKNLVLRVDNVAENGINVPTSMSQPGHVAEPTIAALESKHQQIPTGENPDTQMPDRTASESIAQQHTIITDANMLIPEDIAAEPTLHQQLITLKALTPVPNVQISQVTSLKPTIQRDEPMNEAISIASAVPTSVADLGTEKQPYASRTVSNSAIPLSKPIILESDVKPVKTQPHVMQLPTETTKQKPLPVPQSIFDKFKSTYPVYPGDIKHFAAICKKISQLVQANRMEHQSLWDDFIIRHKIDYSQYLQQCAENAEDAVTYEIFYQTEIEGPQYQKRVINRRNLDAALALVAQQSTSKQDHADSIRDDITCVEPVDHKVASNSSPVEKVHHEHAPASNDKPLESLGPKSTPKPAVSPTVTWKPFESQVLIDLTIDDPPDDAIKKKKESEITPQRNFSHPVNNFSVGPQRSQHRRDSSGSSHQVPSTPSSILGSHVSLTPRPVQSPLTPTTVSTRKATKRSHRLLPWQGSGHSVPRSSAKVTINDVSSGSPGSRLGEIHPEASNSVGNADLQISTQSPPSGPKQSRFLNTCHRVIQSNWGIKACDLLGPEYSNGQVWSENMVEVLAEIASRTKVGEARKRIKDVIETRIGDGAQRSAGHVSQGRRILQSDLELVRDVVSTSSMNTTSPCSPPHTNAAAEKPNEGTPVEWWDDENTPYKRFALAYASLRPGNGNSFAKADHKEARDARSVQATATAASHGAQRRKIDITKWNL